jgi:hypothetical protein
MYNRKGDFVGWTGDWKRTHKDEDGLATEQTPKHEKGNTVSFVVLP